MPTYDYQCDACGHRFEKFQSITAAPIRKCPECGKNRVRRLLGTGGGIIFKGSGFYTTDYRDASYKDKANAERGASGASGEAKSAETKTPTNSEAKPATEKPAAAKAEPKHRKKSSE